MTELKSLRENWLLRLPPSLLRRLEHVPAEFVIESKPSGEKVTSIVIDDMLSRKDKAASVLSRHGFPTDPSAYPLRIDNTILASLRPAAKAELEIAHDEFVHQKNLFSCADALIRASIVNPGDDTDDVTVWPSAAVLRQRVDTMPSIRLPYTRENLKQSIDVLEAELLCGTFIVDVLPSPGATAPMWVSSHVPSDSSAAVYGKVVRKLACAEPRRVHYINDVEVTELGRDRLSALGLPSWDVLLSQRSVATASQLECTLSAGTNSAVERRRSFQSLVVSMARQHGRVSVSPGVYLVPIKPNRGDIAAVVYGPAVPQSELFDDLVSAFRESVKDLVDDNGVVDGLFDAEEEEFKGFMIRKNGGHQTKRGGADGGGDLRSEVVRLLQDRGAMKEADIQFELGKPVGLRGALSAIATMTDASRRIWTLNAEFS
eukprot:PhM_4_TR3393/c0_g1_i2/m.78298